MSKVDYIDDTNLEFTDLEKGCIAHLINEYGPVGPEVKPTSIGFLGLTYAHKTIGKLPLKTFMQYTEEKRQIIMSVFNKLNGEVESRKKRKKS